MSLMFFAMIFIMITMSIASVKRIYEVLEEESTIKNCDKPLYDVLDGSIEFKDVVFGYNKTAERPVLDHFYLKIESGETIGVLGGTGSAKSTLVSMISRLYDVDEGQVLVAGQDVRNYGDLTGIVEAKELFSDILKVNKDNINPPPKKT